MKFKKVETKHNFTLVDYFDFRSSELQNLFLLITWLLKKYLRYILEVKTVLIKGMDFYN